MLFIIQRNISSTLLPKTYLFRSNHCISLFQFFLQTCKTSFVRLYNLYLHYRITRTNELQRIRKGVSPGTSLPNINGRHTHPTNWGHVPLLHKPPPRYKLMIFFFLSCDSNGTSLNYFHLKNNLFLAIVYFIPAETRVCWHLLMISKNKLLQSR